MKYDPVMRSKPRMSQKGAVAVEMALVFSLFITLLWGMISYALPFFLMQVMNHATSEAVRAAVRADPRQGTTAYTTKLQALATARLTQETTWLPAGMRNALVSSVSVTSITGIQMLVVKLTYVSYNTHPIVPILRLPGIGSVPNIPGDLKAESRFRLEASF